MDKWDCRIWRVKKKVRRNFAISERERGFDEPGHACGLERMADVGFDRTDAAAVATTRRSAVGLQQRRHFDRITELRSGPVRFDKRDRLRIDGADRERFTYRRRLANWKMYLLKNFSLLRVYPILISLKILNLK